MQQPHAINLLANMQRDLRPVPRVRVQHSRAFALPALRRRRGARGVGDDVGPGCRAVHCPVASVPSNSIPTAASVTSVPRTSISTVPSTFVPPVPSVTSVPSVASVASVPTVPSTSALPDHAGHRSRAAGQSICPVHRSPALSPRRGSPRSGVRDRSVEADVVIPVLALAGVLVLKLRTRCAARV